MKDSGFSSWPTPMAGTPAQNGNSAAGNNDFSRKAEELAHSMWPTATAHSFAQTADNPTPGQTGGTTLAGAAELMWPTVQARDVRMGDGPESERRARKTHDVTPRGRGQVPSAKAGNACLATDAQNWGTPRASDGEKGGPNQAFGAGGKPLPAQAAQWPTPVAAEIEKNPVNHAAKMALPRAERGGGNLPTPASRDHKGENSPDHLINGTGRLHMDQLPNAVAHGFTLPAPAPMTHGPTLSQLRPIWRRLRASLIASHGRAVWLRLWAGRNKKRLNPEFVGWLMGWPPGHALCDCSETEWHLWQRHMRIALSRLPMASGPWIWSPQKPQPPQPIQASLFGD